jgi:4-amino-4-deoxy-L-arabinose transferase-like glycosyltransferase
MIVAATVYYAWFPTYYLLGGRDPGIYLDVAAHISHTGGTNFYDPLLPELKEIMGEGLRLGYPAFTSAYELGLSSDMGQLIPQFMHLFPSVAAHFFSWFGVEGVVRANCFIGGLAALAFFAFGRLLFGSKVALLALLFLLINPAVVWVNRITLSEPLLLLVNFTGLYALVMAVRTYSVFWGGLGGLILGVGILDRLDGAFSILAIVGLCFYAAVFERRAAQAAKAAVGAYALFFILGFGDAYLHSYQYLAALWHKGGGPIKKLLYLNVAALIASVALLVLGQRKREAQETTIQRGRSWLPAVVTFLLLSLFAFAYIARPRMDPSRNGRALVELCWYITPALPILAIFGVGFLFRERAERSLLGEWLPFALLILGTMAVYTWRPSIQSDHIWASRRWVPYTIPGILLLGTYGFSRLTEVFLKPSYSRLLAGGLSAYYAFSIFFLLAPFALQSMLATYPAAYSKTIETLPPRALLLINNGWVPSILKWVYQKDAYMVKWGGLPSDSLPKLLYRFKDKAIYVAGSLRGFPFSTDVGLEELPGLVLTGPYPEAVHGNFSRRLIVRRHENPIFRLNSTGTLRLHAGGAVMYTRVGKKAEGEMISQGVKGNLVFGPYLSLSEGQYRVVWSGEVLDSTRLNAKYGDSKHQVAHVDVVAGKGTIPISMKPIYGADILRGSIETPGFAVSMTAVLLKPYDDVEFRFYLDEPIYIKLLEVNVAKLERRADLP